MGRGPRINKRLIEPDAVYKSRLVTRLINRVMERGKKTVARRIVYDALGKLAPQPKGALQIFETAFDKIRPSVEVRSRRVGGANYQIPAPVKHDRAEALAIRWLVTTARGKKGKPMSDRLADELKAAAKGEGAAVKKRAEAHRMAEANKAFSHFRW